MKSLATVLVLISSLFLHGCSVRQAWGIKPDDVSQFQIESSREQVEKLLDAPIEVSECPDGTRAKYVYNRGHPPEDHPIIVTILATVLFVPSVGTSEAGASCIFICQRGNLEIVFDHNDTVVLLRPHPDAYDVGWYCDSGDPYRNLCKPTQNAASRMDPARLIRGPNDLLIETGCFSDFSKVCQLAHEKRPTAQWHLGRYYLDGLLPVSQSYVEAYKWYSLAIQGGVLYAEDTRDRVAKKLSADELAEAEHLASEWQPNPAECGGEKVLYGD